MRRSENKLSPPCALAHTLANRECTKEHMSLAFIRAIIDSVPTYPHAWTIREGRDYCDMWQGR